MPINININDKFKRARGDEPEEGGGAGAPAPQMRQRRPQSETGPDVGTLSKVTGVAVAVAIAGALFGAFGMTSGMSARAELEQATIDVVLTTGEIAQGHTIEQKDVVERAVRASDAPDNAIANASDVVGSIAATAMSRNAIVTESAVAGDAAAELAGRIAEDHLALTIAVSQQSGIAGLVRQGDLVDVYDTDAESGESVVRVAEGARVLALDEQLDGADAEYTAVTIEVDTKDVKDVATAAAGGHATLALQPTKAAEQAPAAEGGDE